MTDSPIPEPCTCHVPCTCGSQAATIASLKAALEEPEGREAWLRRCVDDWRTEAEMFQARVLEVEGERDAAVRDAEELRSALHGAFGKDGWRIADSSEVGVPKGTFIRGGAQWGGNVSVEKIQVTRTWVVEVEVGPGGWGIDFAAITAACNDGNLKRFEIKRIELLGLNGEDGK